MKGKQKAEYAYKVIDVGVNAKNGFGGYTGFKPYEFILPTAIPWVIERSHQAEIPYPGFQALLSKGPICRCGGIVK